MPHTRSRYQQEAEFTDARIFVGMGDIVNVTSAGTVTPTRSAAGNYNYAISASTTTYFACNVANIIMRRTGFGMDLQEEFGGTGISGAADPQPSRPDLIGSMSTGQEITPRTALQVKGFRLTGFDTIYTVTGAAFGTLESRVDKTVFVNDTAPAITSVVALAANGLTNATQTNPYVINYTLTSTNLQAISNPATSGIYYPGYVYTVDTALWLELDVVTGSSATGVFYGFDLLLSFNFN